MRRVEPLDVQEIKLSTKQKLILKVLKDEFGGSAFGPEMLEKSESKTFTNLTINEVTWHMLRLRDSGLVSSEKKIYKGRQLNKYTITPYIIYEGVKIK